VLLDENCNCRVYGIRPSACVVYPFELAVFDIGRDGSLRMLNLNHFFNTTGQLPTLLTPGTGGYNYLVPLLLADRDCPGFTGEPSLCRVHGPRAITPRTVSRESSTSAAHRLNANRIQLRIPDDWT
jgi:Fe-S-cluster containining protein